MMDKDMSQRPVKALKHDPSCLGSLRLHHLSARAPSCPLLSGIYVRSAETEAVGEVRGALEAPGPGSRRACTALRHHRLRACHPTSLAAPSQWNNGGRCGLAGREHDPLLLLLV